MEVNFNSIQPTSTIDYPGKIACVVFFNGCPWRCGYCHNKQTWTEVNMVDVEYVKEQIKSCLPFVSAVVFSGGEPTRQLGALEQLCKFSKEKGLFVGIETNGFNTNALLLLKIYVDVFFIDIKAPLNDPVLYFQITGEKEACYCVDRTLNMHTIPIEIRIVDTGNAKQTSDSIKTKHKITILPYIKRK